MGHKPWTSQRGLVCPVAVSLWAVIAAIISTTAEAADENQISPFGWREVWAGVDASTNVWLFYSGMTVAPFSADIYSNGWRFRTAGGYGQYNYETSEFGSEPCGQILDRIHCRASRHHFNATFTYSDMLIGYQQRLGDLTAKAFVGVSAIDHDIRPRDRHNDVAGFDYGVKGVAEFWYNIGSDLWTSLDLAYATAHETQSARLRAGWRALPTLSIGPEVRFDSNAEDQATRAGLFARYEWRGGEISAAAGYTGDMTGGLDNRVDPYATLNVLFQY